MRLHEHRKEHELMVLNNEMGLGIGIPSYPTLQAAIDAGATTRVGQFQVGLDSYVCDGVNYSLIASKTIRNIASNLLPPIGFTYNRNQANSYKIITIRDDTSNFQIEFPNWATKIVNSKMIEEIPTSALSISAALEYPLGTVVKELTFSGNAVGSIAGGKMLLCDAVTSLTIPAGSRVGIRMYLQSAYGIPSSNVTSPTAGELFEYAVTGLVDKHLAGTIVSNASAVYSPTAFISLSNKPSVLMLCDSRGTGNNNAADPVDLTLNNGILARSVGKYFAYTNISRYSDKLSDFLLSNAIRVAMAKYHTHVWGSMGINDLATTDTAATVTANISAVAALFPGKNYSHCTIGPVSSSTNLWVDFLGQTPNATSNPKRVVVNNNLRNGLVRNVVATIEIADIEESSRDSGCWISNGIANYYTDSAGLHETTPMNLLIAASPTIPLFLITN